MGRLLFQLGIAWPVSLVLLAVLGVFWGRMTGHADSGLREAILGLGVILLVPSLLFALLVGAPFMSLLAKQNLPGLLIPFAAAAGLALVMWLLSSALLPQGWKGAGAALVAYSGMLGLLWGGLHLLTGSRNI